jgi:hypothetical protein
MDCSKPWLEDSQGHSSLPSGVRAPVLLDFWHCFSLDGWILSLVLAQMKVENDCIELGVNLDPYRAKRSWLIEFKQRVGLCSLLLYSKDKSQPRLLVFASNRDRGWQFWAAHLPRIVMSMERSQQLIIHIHLPQAPRDAEPGRTALKPLLSQSLLSVTGEQPSQDNRDNPVIWWWSGKVILMSQVAVCVFVTSSFLCKLARRTSWHRSWHDPHLLCTFAWTEN